MTITKLAHQATGMDEHETVDRIATKALVETYRNDALFGKLPKIAELAARQHARRELRAFLRPFVPKDPPARPADPAALQTYFLPPAPGPPSPVPTPKPAKPPATKEEKRLYAKEFFAAVFKEESTSLEDLHPARVRVVYRLVRELARHTRALADEQLLMDLPDPSWVKPLRPMPTTDPLRRRTSFLLREGPDLALIPPPAPTDLTNYNPDNDQDLQAYIQALECLAADLQVHNGTTTEPYLGRYGLQGLTEPGTCRLAFPGQDELLAWEQQLVEDALTSMLARGTRGAFQWLAKTHGLRVHEALPLLKAANAQAQLMADGDLEEKRAKLILRLEDLRRRARRSGLNLNLELGTMKLEALVEGFARSEPENLVNELVATVRRVNEQDAPKQLTVDEPDDEDEEAA